MNEAGVRPPPGKDYQTILFLSLWARNYSGVDHIPVHTFLYIVAIKSANNIFICTEKSESALYKIVLIFCVALGNTLVLADPSQGWYR